MRFTYVMCAGQVHRKPHSLEDAIFIFSQLVTTATPVSCKMLDARQSSVVVKYSVLSVSADGL